MKLDPIPVRKPSPAQLGKGLNQVHACVEDFKEKTAGNFQEVRNDLSTVHEEVTLVKDDVLAIKQEFGVGDPNRKVAATRTRWQTARDNFMTTVGAFTAVVFVIKASAVIGPHVGPVAESIWEVIVALYHAALTGKL